MHGESVRHAQVSARLRLLMVRGVSSSPSVQSEAIFMGRLPMPAESSWRGASEGRSEVVNAEAGWRLRVGPACLSQGRNLHGAPASCSAEIVVGAGGMLDLLLPTLIQSGRLTSHAVAEGWDGWV